MIASFLFTAAWCSSLVAAFPSPRYVVHETRSHVTPTGWKDMGRYDSNAILPLRFGLVQQKQDVNAILNDIADPKSPNYGKHWTHEQVRAKFSALPETVDKVHEWLSTHFDIDRIYSAPSGNWLEVNSSVSEAETLLRTKYNSYVHEVTGQKHVACQSYQIPSQLKDHIDLVTPTVHFNARISSEEHIKREETNIPARRIGQPINNKGLFSPPLTNGPPLLRVSTSADSCDEQTTLDCLRALYQVNYTLASPDNNSFAIVEYTPQAYTASDLSAFFATYSPDQVGQLPIFTSIQGGLVQNQSVGFTYNGESNLDFTYGMGLVGPGQAVTLYQVGDMSEGASFNDLLDALDGSYCTFEGGDDPKEDAIYPNPNMTETSFRGKKECGTVKPANVISTSYAYNEADLTPFYVRRQCQEYAKLGMMGVTVIYSSGDFGVAGNSGNCLNADGSLSPDGPRFNPSFPGTCPYVTVVGATQIAPNNTVADPETACETVIYSGGGFSNVFALPEYQENAVTSYLQDNPPNYTADQYNNTGAVRGLPDISANGANYVVPVGGSFMKIYGTSASTPVIAAMITMINDARITAGKSTVGFINPALYSDDFADAFNDITSGGNPGCGTPGFSAVPGWDPVTGLGTPKFPTLMDRFLSLP